MRSITNQVVEAHGERKDHHPGAVVRQEHESEILPALQRRRHGIGQSRRAEEIAEGAFENKREAESEQQSVEMVELIEPLQKQPLDDDAGDPHRDGGDDDRPPITYPRILQQEERRERAQHVLGAVGEVDDVEHAEDDGKPQAEQRVERAVDEPDEQLPEQGLGADAEQFEHG